jgi:hypothetical protein
MYPTTDSLAREQGEEPPSALGLSPAYFAIMACQLLHTTTTKESDVPAQ